MNDKKVKFLTIGVILLVVLNIALITFLLVNKPSRSGHKYKHGSQHETRGIGFLIKSLELEQNQKKLFLEAFKKHNKERKELDQQMKKNKGLMIASIMADKPQQTDSLLTIISQLNAQAELSLKNHFIEIRALCSEEQAKKLAEVLAKRGKSDRK